MYSTFVKQGRCSKGERYRLGTNSPAHDPRLIIVGLAGQIARPTLSLPNFPAFTLAIGGRTLLNMLISYEIMPIFQFAHNHRFDYGQAKGLISPPLRTHWTIPPVVSLSPVRNALCEVSSDAVSVLASETDSLLLTTC